MSTKRVPFARAVYRTGGALFLLTLLAALLRVAALGRQPLWLDEATDAWFATRSFWNCVFAEAVHPPLYRSLLHFVVLGFGDSATAVRLLPAVFGVLAAPAAWLLARRLFPRSELIATLLVAASPFLIFFSQENRDYSLLILLTIVSTWLFLRFAETGRGLGAYAASCILLLYTHYLCVFVLVAHEAVYWFHVRKRLGAWIGARVCAVAIFLPWAVWMAERYRSESRTFLNPAWLIPIALLRFLLGYGVTVLDSVWQAEPLRTRLMREAPVLVPSLSLLGWLVWRGWRRAAADPQNRMLYAVILFLPWMSLVCLAPWIRLSDVRYLAFQAPFVLLLAAAGLSSLPGVRKLLAGTAAILVMAFALTAYYNAPGTFLGYRLRYGKENWSAAAAFMRKQRVDAIIIAPGYLAIPLDRYPLGAARTILMPAESWRAPQLGDTHRVALLIGRPGKEQDRLQQAMSAAYPSIAKAAFPSQNLIRVTVYDTSHRNFDVARHLRAARVTTESGGRRASGIAIHRFGTGIPLAVGMGSLR